MIESGVFLAERYEVIEQIGTGGMADVYKAKDHKLNRFVAIKVLKQEFREDNTFNSKFRTEAQSAAGLIHPNIVSVYDVGEEDQHHYIVMELIEGITLKDYIRKKGRLGYKEAISIAIQVCNGIDVAHKNNIIHRDIKPHNIMISRDGKVKVTDFGIARATSSNTISSNAMGSVHYTSPEQARGGYSDAKSDIYSLGITLYEMVTGRVPFDGDTTVAIAIKHLQEEIVPPSEYAEDLPGSLEQIIIKCTQKGSDRRYANMDAVVADLKRALTDPEGEFVNLIPINNNDQTVIMGEEDLSKIKQTTGTIMFDLDDEDEFDDFEEDDDEDIYDDDEDEEVNPRINKIMKILRIVMGVIILCIVLFVGARATGLFKGFGTKEEKIEVPDVSGRTEEEATKILEDLDFKVKLGKPVESEEDEIDKVVKQTPKDGSQLEKGGTVTIYLGAGPSDEGEDKEEENGDEEEETVDVPQVNGATEDAAKSMLTQAGLKAREEYVYSDSVANGVVISSTPAQGSKAKKGETVVLQISKGQQDTRVEVANVVGKTESEARSALGQFNVEVASEYNTADTKGKVIWQSIQAGTKADPGTKITLTISLGAKPEEKPATETKKFVLEPVDMGPFYGKNVHIKIVRNDTGGELHNKSYTNWTAESFEGEPTNLTVNTGTNTVQVTVTITPEGESASTVVKNMAAQ